MSAHAIDLSDSVTSGVREVTDQEVASYREHGWVKLENLLSAELVEGLLARIQARMGSEAERVGGSERSNVPNIDLVKVAAQWQTWENPSLEDDWIRELSQSVALGALASRLVRDRPMRWYTDAVLAKLPAERAGTSTSWHQDLPFQAFDRSGAAMLWIALVDCPPEKGTMRFLSGSHRASLLGRFGYGYGGADAVDDIVAYYPELLEEYEVSPPLHLRAGDATVHDFGLVHSAPQNTTNSVRWTYSAGWFPADALYTGASNKRTAGLGLEINKRFEHPRFPVVFPAPQEQDGGKQ